MEALRQHVLSGEEEMKCKVCAREAVEEFCPYHLAAKSRLEEAYPRWVKAYGKMGWNEFLDNVKRDLQTGQWAKEMAALLGGTA